MSSELDTPMFRAMAMIVVLDTEDMQRRARELEQKYPDRCCVSDISAGNIRTPQLPYLYYLGPVNEEWIRTGQGEP